MKKKIYSVVLGVADTGYGIIRSLSESDAPIIGFEKNFSAPEVHTKLCEKVYKYKNHQHLLSLLVDFSNKLTEKPVLFITSDPLVMFCIENKDVLSQYYRFHLPEKSIVVTLMEKQKFQQYAERHDCTIPQTVYCNDYDEISHAIERLAPPYIVKPYLKSELWKNAGMDQGIIFNNRETCKKKIKGLLKIESNLIIQEYVEGEDSSIFFCLVYFDENHKCQGSFCGNKVRQWPLLIGDTASAIPCENREIVSETIRFFNKIGFQGFGSMEFKKHPFNHKYYMIEPTVGRPDHQSHIATANGVNLPLIAYSKLTQDRVKAPCCKTDRKEVMWIDEPHELVSVFHYLYKGQSKLVEITRSLRRKKVYRFFNIKDPVPFFFFLLWSFKKIIKIISGLFRNYNQSLLSKIKRIFDL